MNNMKELEKLSPELYSDVFQIIDGTRFRIATTVNAEVCLMNWNIGKRIKEVSVCLSTYFLIKTVFLALGQKNETSLHRKGETEIHRGL